MKASEIISVLYIAVKNKQDVVEKLRYSSQTTGEIAKQAMLRADILSDIADVLYETAYFLEKRNE